MTQYSIHTREGWPSDAATLLADYPREAWPGHPNFAQSIQNWLGAHQGFRQLGDLVRSSTEEFLDREIAPDRYARALGYYGNILVRNLHGHYTWEDRNFFPEISTVDDRLDHGLDTRESDHHALDETIETLTEQANRTIKLVQLDELQARSEAGKLHDTAAGLERFLDRHLTDEEDLIVPIVLHHKMRG